VDAVARDPGGFTPQWAATELLRLSGREPAPVELCRPCLDYLGGVYDQETRNPELGTAVIFGLLAAVVASLAWYTVEVGMTVELSFGAAVVGWLVGQAVAFGAGHKRGTSLQVIALGITGVAMVAASYLIEHHRLAAALAGRGLPGLPLVLPVSTSVGMVVVGLTADPLNLVFWAIALLAAYRVPAARHLVSVKQRQEPAEAVGGEAR
jgi:hypothetical protein